MNNQINSSIELTNNFDINHTANVYGNYHQYYTFHSVESRMNILKKKLEVNSKIDEQISNSFFDSFSPLQYWKSIGSPPIISLLDLGCNEGTLSLSLRDFFVASLPSDVKVILVGLDIDPHLINLAKETVKTRSEKRISEGKEGEESYIFFDCVNIMENDQLILFLDKLKLKFSQFLPSSFSTEETSKVDDCPRSILQKKLLELKIFFHFISVFSTTMWLHINYGQVKLLNFLKILSVYFLNESGVLLLEPQPKKCYKTAIKRLKVNEKKAQDPSSQIASVSFPPYLNKILKKINTDDPIEMMNLFLSNLIKDDFQFQIENESTEDIEEIPKLSNKQLLKLKLEKKEEKHRKKMERKKLIESGQEIDHNDNSNLKKMKINEEDNEDNNKESGESNKLFKKIIRLGIEDWGRPLILYFKNQY